MSRATLVPTLRAALATCVLASIAGPASAQMGGPPPVALKSPVEHQVIQRDANGTADVPVVLPDDLKAGQILRSTFVGAAAARLVDGRIEAVPAGGPYSIQCEVDTRDKSRGIVTVQSGPFYVGDLWVLAGQSNMEGVGDLVDVTPPQPYVMALGMDGRWAKAREPLHWMVDSPDPVHHGDEATRAKRSAEQHKGRTKGAGLGLPFASAMLAATKVPIGLVACAHGGTSLEEWSPSKRDEGGKSLYGSMLRQVRLAGGKVRGVLWYQGESDAIAGKGVADAYGKTFADFIAEVRKDFDQPDLPFYFVQIGRFVTDRDPAPWNAVQDAQRRLPETVHGTAVVAAIDLELDDAIHVGTDGLKRLGGRLARVALRELTGQGGATTPTLDRVARGPNNTLSVRFKGVNRAPAAPPAGGMMMGAGGANPGMRPVQGTGPESAGLHPDRHVSGFSIRAADGKALPLIYEAKVGPSRDTVVLKVVGAIPEGATLWYGGGLDPVCHLVDDLDMAVPAFGPIPLDPIR